MLLLRPAAAALRFVALPRRLHQDRPADDVQALHGAGGRRERG